MTIKNLSIFYFLSVPILIFSSRVLTITIGLDIQNNCPNTIWAAAVPGGGKRLNKGETWTLDVKPGTTNARIWARTNCKFDKAGRGKCDSGDCSGLLECRANGQPPHTLAIFAVYPHDEDSFDITLVNGFNVPIEISPSFASCSTGSKCVGDVNGPCPQELRDPGGCNNPCTVFKNDQFCCTSGTRSCEPTNYSRFFKAICPDALTYPKDWNSFTCPSGSNYTVVFCPNESSGSSTQGARFDITNNCPFVVWAAAAPGGGQQLNQGQTWTLDVSAGTKRAGIWARTGCNFDASGRGSCQTGDCGGVLQCQAFGQPPNTRAEYALNQFQNLDFFDISLVDGFNVKMDFSPTSPQCTTGIKCTGAINEECPNELRAQGGCNNPCTVYKTDQYCCNPGNCGPTPLSKFFKDRCPDAYSYPKDDQTSTFTCPGGTNYKVVFCP